MLLHRITIAVRSGHEITASYHIGLHMDVQVSVLRWCFQRMFYPLISYLHKLIDGDGLLAAGMGRTSRCDSQLEHADTS